MSTTTVPIATVEIEPNSFHLLVDAEINGKSVKLIVDTGASRSVIDQGLDDEFSSEGNQVEALGFNSGRTKLRTVRFRNIKIGTREFPRFEAAIADLSTIRELYDELTGIEIGGLLGCDFLLTHFSGIDLKRGYLLVLPERRPFADNAR